MNGEAHEAIPRAARSSRRSVLPALGLATDPGPRPALDAWTVVGPGGGGTMRRPAISPHDPKRRRARLRHDRGLHHRGRRRVLADVQLRHGADRLRLRPVATPQTIYAGAEAVYRERRRRPHVAHGPAGPRAEHRGEDDRGPRRPRPLHRRPRLSRQRPQRHRPRDRGGRGRPASRVWRSPRAPPTRPVPGTPASPTLLLGSTDRGRTWSRLAALRLGAGLRAPVERRREARRECTPLAETGVYESARGRRCSTSRRPAGPASPRRASGATRARRRRVRLRDPAARRRPGRDRRRRSACPRTAGRSWRRRERSAARAAAAEVGRGERVGTRRRLAPSLGPVAVSAHSPLVAYVGLRGLMLAAGGDAQFNGIAKTTDGGRTWTVVHAESDEPSPNLARRPGSSARGRGRATPSGSTRPTTSRSRPPTPRSPTRPTSSAATGRRDGGKTLGAGQLRATRGRPAWTTRGLDVTTTYGIQFDPHDRTASSSRYTDIGPLPQRGRGRDLDRLDPASRRRWRNTTYWLAFDPEVKDLVVGWLQRHPRPAAAEDVAAHRPGTVPGRASRVSTDGGGHWTPSNAGHGGVGDHARARSTRGARRGRRTLYACRVRPRRLQVHRQRADAGGSRTPASTPTAEPALRLAAHARSAPDGALYLVVARRSERGRIGDARRRRALPLDRRRRELDAHRRCRPGRMGRTASPSTRRTRGGSTSRPGA